MKDDVNIFTPIKIGNVILKNRIVASATSMQIYGENDSMTRETIAYYEAKAKGGAGLVIIGETPVERSTGMSHPKMLNLEAEDSIDRLGYVVDAVKRHGAAISLQLSHGGAGCDPHFNHGRKPMGPSADIGVPGLEIEEMTEEMILDLVEAFGDKANILWRAGFDMVQVHAGHGWLLGQFLSPFNNKRKDQYGGSIENNVRIVQMVIDNIRKKTKGQLAIDLRISGDEFMEGGYHLDTAIEYCKLLDDRVDLFNISSSSIWDKGGVGICTPSLFEARARNAYLAEEIKKHVSKPVTAVGGFNRPEIMEELISDRKVDLICVARQTLADPEFPNKMRDGKYGDIRPCIRCMACMSSMMVSPEILRCSVNPVIGRELLYNKPIEKVKTPKKVLVIGGGIGGMQAALTASQRGHHVTLVEAKDELGGILTYSREVPFKDDLYYYLEYLRNKVMMAPVTLRFRTKVTAENVKQYQPDTIICAIGAEEFLPSVPGMETGRVYTALQAHEQIESLGQNIVVVGGGFTGIECAIELRITGRNIEIIEMGDEILPGIFMQQRAVYMEELRRCGLNDHIHTNTKVVQIAEDTVICEKSDDEVEFAADDIIFCTGMKNHTKEVFALSDICKDVRIIGDCKKPRRIMDAVAEAYFTALDI